MNFRRKNSFSGRSIDVGTQRHHVLPAFVLPHHFYRYQPKRDQGNGTPIEGW